MSAAWLFSQDTTEPMVYSDIVSAFKDDRVTEFIITKDNVLTASIINDKTGKEEIVEYRLRDLYLFESHVGKYIDNNYKTGNLQYYNYEEPQVVAWWVSYLPFIILAVIFIALWFFVMNQATGKGGGKIASFSRARTKMGSDEKKKVLFSDVAGADEEKEELTEIVDFLRAPKKYTAMGARIPRGVLLIGPPGTGKTLLAKAVAGEAGVPFYSISGSDFVEMYVGVGASRVRDLFETAKKTSPSIIFIDEIDAVGRHRGAGLGGGHDEREQTLNQLLVEMDGFGSNDGVIVIAATNRPDILDPALLRPGRFDRQVTVNYPDIKGRVDILKVHAKDKHFEETVDFEVIARTTVGFTGADLANLLNEAALITVRSGKSLIGVDEIEEAMLKVIVGPKKKSKKISEREKKITAYHEAGHAIATYFSPTQDPVHQISIIPSGRAGGYTLSIPQEDRSYKYKSEMLEDVVTLLGGRVAEKLVLNDISTGASNDIERATEIARKMIMRYGMSDDLGPIVYGTGHDEVFLGKEFSSSRNYSEKIAAQIDDEVMNIIKNANLKAESLLTDHMDKLHFVAGYLVKNETMDAEQFECAMQPDSTEEQLDAIRDKKKEKSKNENDIKREEIERDQSQEKAEEIRNNASENDSDTSAQSSDASED
ncbi:MAG: ATP-dependent zinc metalloprotease FtsH [Ruminococcaceae bacterium]|nr:ATP-dependent zinc metalloprotease FtsH [Oscillospiraceae bacterium]